MFSNIWEFFTRSATAYGMINLSDLKFVPLTAEAVYRYLWSPQSFNASASCLAATLGGHLPQQRDAAGRRGHLNAWPMPRPGVAGCKASDFGAVTPTQAQDAFYLEFSQRHYGASAGAAAAQLYGRYFNISYMANAVTGQATLADHYLGSQLRTLLSHVTPSGKDKGLPAAAAECASVAAANLPFVADLYLNGVVPLAATLPAGSPALRFYQAHLAAQAALHYYHLVAFQASAAGAYALMGNGTLANAVGNFSAALAAMDDLRAVFRVAEGTGVWHGSYAADGWTWVWGSRQTLAYIVAQLQGRVIAAAPSNPYPDYAFMTYEIGMANLPTGAPTFPFYAFNASVAFDLLPRFACAADVPGSSAVAAPECDSTWVGVTITKPTMVGLFTAPYTGAGARTTTSTIHYTLDGSAPTPSSPAYTGSFQVSAACTVKAQSFDDAGAPVSGVSSGDVSMA